MSTGVMTTQYLEYQGYLGTIKPQLASGTLFGKLAFIRDLVTYEAPTLAELEQEFHISVDLYLASREELGYRPNKPCPSLQSTYSESHIICHK